MASCVVNPTKVLLRPRVHFVVCFSVLIVLGLGVLAQEQGAEPTNPFQGLTGKTIMVFTPHPDDDIIGCGGALTLLSGKKNRLVVVFLTAGEKGTFDPSVKPEALRRIRMAEARAAYRALGFPDAELIWLGYPDGELDFASPRPLRIKLVRLIRKYRPEVVFSLDPGARYYRYHYRDHRSAALVVADAIGAAMWPLEYPEPGVSAFRAPNVFYFYTAEPNVRLDIGLVYQRKRQALAEHRSQFPPASEHYTAEGPPPSPADMENLIVMLTGQTTTELFRRR